MMGAKYKPAYAQYDCEGASKHDEGYPYCVKHLTPSNQMFPQAFVLGL